MKRDLKQHCKSSGCPKITICGLSGLWKIFDMPQSQSFMLMVVVQVLYTKNIKLGDFLFSVHPNKLKCTKFQDLIRSGHHSDHKSKLFAKKSLGLLQLKSFGISNDWTKLNLNLSQNKLSTFSSCCPFLPIILIKDHVLNFCRLGSILLGISWCKSFSPANFAQTK